MDRHDNLLLVLMILTNFYVNCCAWPWAQLACYTRLRNEDRETLETTGTYTETIEATGTPAEGQGSSDGDLLRHRHACTGYRRLQQ